MECRADRPAAPDEGATIPRDTFLTDQLLGAGRLGFLLEPQQWISLKGGDLISALHVRNEIPVFGRGTIDLDSQGDKWIGNVERRAPRNLGGVSQHALVDGDVRDRLIGRQDQHHLVVRTLDRHRRECDGRRRVATHRLEQERRRWCLVANERLVLAIGDDRDVVGHAAEPIDRRLEQGTLTEERQERFGPLGRAQRVETGAPAAGQDDGVHGRQV